VKLLSDEDVNCCNMKVAGIPNAISAGISTVIVQYKNVILSDMNNIEIKVRCLL